MRPLWLYSWIHTSKSVLKLVQCSIDLFPERHAVELVQHRLVDPFADPIGLGMPRFRAGMINVLHRQIEFVLMAFGRAAIFGPPIGQDPVQGNLVLLEER